LVQGYDGCDYKPLSGVTVKVTNITDRAYAVPILHNIRSGSDGYYYRLLNPGVYAVSFEMPGYKTAVGCVRIDRVPQFDEDLRPAKILNAVLYDNKLEVPKDDAGRLNALETVHSYGKSRCGDLLSLLEDQKHVSFMVVLLHLYPRYDHDDDDFSVWTHTLDRLQPFNISLIYIFPI
uniref:Fn3_3 domain-containing protein n=1 Tax=Echinostoma caproni TaxID=27848 RepID=A0A183B8W2_9TREM